MHQDNQRHGCGKERHGIEIRAFIEIFRCSVLSNGLIRIHEQGLSRVKSRHIAAQVKSDGSDCATATVAEEEDDGRKFLSIVPLRTLPKANGVFLMRIQVRVSRVVDAKQE